MDVKRFKEIMGVFPSKKILVVGDLILDRYVNGEVSRISPEAPVPVVHVSEEHSQPGGAANVAVNIQSLGGQVVVAGVVGRDAAADELKDVLTVSGISTEGILASDDVQTTVKTRVVAGRQQVVRVDKEDSAEAVSGVAKDFIAILGRVATDVDGIIIEDYGKGAISQQTVNAILAAAVDLGLPVALDPKDNHELDLSGIALATPNYKEACEAAGLREAPLADDPASNETLAEASKRLQEKWGADLLIITLGSKGMCLVGQKQDAEVIPTKAQEVFDVSGAGDTVIATAFLSLLAGASHREAAELANHAAGVVVGKLGTATCTREELLNSL